MTNPHPTHHGPTDATAAPDGNRPDGPTPLRFALYIRTAGRRISTVQAQPTYARTSAQAMIEPCGGVIVAEYIDNDPSSDVAWADRPQAAALLAEVANPERGFDAIVCLGSLGSEVYEVLAALTASGVALYLPGIVGAIDLDRPEDRLFVEIFHGPDPRAPRGGRRGEQ